MFILFLGRPQTLLDMASAVEELFIKADRVLVWSISFKVLKHL